jgi:hypothetical protein
MAYLLQQCMKIEPGDRANAKDLLSSTLFIAEGGEGEVVRVADIESKLSPFTETVGLVQQSFSNIGTAGEVADKGDNGQEKVGGTCVGYNRSQHYQGFNNSTVISHNVGLKFLPTTEVPLYNGGAEFDSSTSLGELSIASSISLASKDF